MPPPCIPRMPLDRAYTLTRFNSFLGMIQDFSESTSYITSFTSTMHVASAAIAVLKHTLAIPRTVFTKPDVREELDRFKARVKEVDEVLSGIGKKVNRTTETMSDCKTSVLMYIQSFLRDVEKHVVVFTPRASFGSILVIAR